MIQKKTYIVYVRILPTMPITMSVQLHDYGAKVLLRAYMYILLGIAMSMAWSNHSHII